MTKFDRRIDTKNAGLERPLMETDGDYEKALSRKNVP
jgi:hypothetical protein